MSLPRYPEYKDSGVEWLGNVPAHWDIHRLTDVTTHNDEVLGDDTPEDAVFLYVDISSVDVQHGINAKEEIVFGSAPSRARRIVRDGDVIVSTVRTYLRAVARIIAPEDNLIVSTGFAVIRPNERFDSRYAGLLLLSHYFVDQVISRSTGVSYPAINASDLVRIPIPTPPFEEQQSIAAFLNAETAKLDALIAEQRRLVELLQEKRQAVISDAVTKGLNPDAPMKSSGIEWLGDVPEHWEVSRVKQATTFVTSGPRGWSERISEDGELFIQSGDLNNRMQIAFDSAKRVRVDTDAETQRTRLVPGDVVVCVTGAKTGNVAVCSEVPETSYVNQHLCLLRPSDRVLPAFLGILLKSGCGQTYFELAQYGLKQGLSLGNVQDAPIVVPPPAEQKEIVSLVEKLSTSVSELESQANNAIELLQERRTALITAAVTGKIDVRGYTRGNAASGGAA